MPSHFGEADRIRVTFGGVRAAIIVGMPSLDGTASRRTHWDRF